MKYIVGLLLTCISLSAIAQQPEDKEHYKKMPLMTLGLGGSFQQFDGLNSRIASLPQYSKLPKDAATISLGWLKEQHRIVTAGEITAGSAMSGHQDRKSSTVRYLGLNLNIGYDLLKSEKTMLYPFAGLGYQSYQALFYKDNSNVDFNDVLQSPAVQNSISSVKFNNAFLVYRLGFAVSIKSPKCPSSSIGIQAGYAGSFKKSNWRSNENQVLNNSPEDKLSQFYISLKFMNKPWMMK
jgi:hypothetical protein